MKLGFFMAFSLCVSLFSISTLGLSGTNACYYPAQKFCVEDGAEFVESDCGADGGEEVEQCPEEYRLGSCTIDKQGKKVIVRYYQGTQINPRQSCRGFGGVYIPD